MTNANELPRIPAVTSENLVIGRMGNFGVFTGESHVLHGVTVYAYRLIEGTTPGAIFVTSKAPGAEVIPSHLMRQAKASARAYNAGTPKA